MNEVGDEDRVADVVYRWVMVVLVASVVCLVVTTIIVKLSEMAHAGKYKTYPVVKSECQDTTREGGDRTYRDTVGVGKDLSGAPTPRFQSCTITVSDTDGKEVVIPDYVTNGIVIKGDKLQLMPHVVRKHAKSN